MIFFFSKGSAGADSGLGSDDTCAQDSRTTTTVGGEQVVLRRSKKSSSSHVKQRPKSEIYRHHDHLSAASSVLPSASAINLKPSESIRRSKRYSAFGVCVCIGVCVCVFVCETQTVRRRGALC